MLEQKSHTF